MTFQLVVSGIWSQNGVKTSGFHQEDQEISTSDWKVAVFPTHIPENQKKWKSQSKCVLMTYVIE